MLLLLLLLMFLLLLLMLLLLQLLLLLMLLLLLLKMLHSHGLATRQLLTARPLALTSCSVCVLARALNLIFGEEGAGTSVIMIQLGRITTVQKFINENLIAHEYFMLGDCFNDDIKHVTLLLSCFIHVLFTNYLYDRLICHASGLS
jgi:hypothetical protein